MADASSSSPAVEVDATPEKRNTPSTPSTAEGGAPKEDANRLSDDGPGERDEDGVSSDCSSSEGGDPEEEEEDEEGEETKGSDAAEAAEDDEERARRAAEEQRDREMDRRQRILNFVEQMQKLRAKTQGSSAGAAQEEAQPQQEGAGSPEADAAADDAEEGGADAEADGEVPGDGKAHEEQDAEGATAAGQEKMKEKLLRMQRMLEALQAEKEPVERHLELLMRGSDCYEEGDFRGAADAFTEVVKMRPRDVDGWSRRGQARLKVGDHEGAMADYSEALRIDDDRADIWFMRASARSDFGDDKGAMADFEESLKHDPEQTDVLCCRGTLRLEQGDHQGAVDDCSTCLDIDACHAGAWGLRGTARHRMGQHRDALEDCERALEIDPDLEWVRSVREAARKAASAAEKRGPPRPQPTSWREFGNSLFREGSFKEAVAAYRAAVDQKEDGWVLALSNQALCHLRMGQHTEAVEAADLCLQQASAPYKVHFTKFKALAARRDWDKAFDALAVLKAMPHLPAEIATLAEQEERAKRQEQERQESLEVAD